MTPLYCGAKSIGYAKLNDGTRGNLTLGRAASISGAAVDPNMSFYQSSALTAFLTLFNARLGYWIKNPGWGGWQAESPKFGDLLFTELLGRTDGRGEFVHLSDGGHFENLGVYELIRRRCRYIVAVDAGEDVDSSDDNLATLIRLSRIDFGVRIQVDTTPLRMAGDDRLTRTHVVVGRVRYDDVDYGEPPGVLVYVKISMTGDEPVDLQKYARKAPDFPHQPTDLRQSFDEEQFESYRCLGDHIASNVFGDAVNRLRKKDRLRGPGSPAHRDYVPQLFSALQARWAEAAVDEEEHFLESTRAWVKIQGDLRTDPNLAGLARDIYPELPEAPAGTPPPADRDRDRAELHTVSQMLQIMQNTWLMLGLKGSSGLPLNRGWMCAFRRWVSTRAFRRCWPILRAEFSPDFARFCETELHLVTAPSPIWQRLPATVVPGSFEGQALDLLAQEFEREWPGEIRHGQPTDRSLPALTPRGPGRSNPAGPPIWLIVQAPSGPLPALQSPEKFVSGIALVAEFPDHPDPSANVSPRRALEFFVWIRRPHRSTGLGSESVRPVLEIVRGELSAIQANQAITLWARYPKSGTDGDNNMERRTWINFFARFDFRPKYPPRNVQWPCSLLVLDKV